MLRTWIDRLAKKFDFIPRILVVKAGLSLLLAVLSAGLFLAAVDTLAKNRKMLRYLKNEAVYRTHLESLRKSKETFATYVKRLETGADNGKIKSEYNTQLLQVITDNKLKIDSYRSEIEEEEGGFIAFKYNVTVEGDFLDVIALFTALRVSLPEMYVDKYDIKVHLEDLVRVGFRAAVIGVRLP